jgi:flagellar basal-body rod protein FlgB
MDITASAALKALDGLYLRQLVSADNVANANATGFVPSQVDFETQLRQALTRSNASPASVAAAQVLQTTLPGATVRLDQEAAAMSQTTLRYQLVMNLLDTRMAMQRAAAEAARGA